MSSFENRIRRLESKQPSGNEIAWAELLDNGRAILRYQDGQRVAASQSDIPHGVKCYQGLGPDDWDKVMS